MGSGQARKEPGIVFCCLVVTIAWALILHSAISQSRLLLAHKDWFARFWIHFDAFGSPGPNWLLNAGGFAPAWLGLFSHGAEPIALKFVANLLLYGKEQSLPVFFFIHGALILHLWVIGWWLECRNVKAGIAISFIGLFLISTCPIVLIAGLAVPYVFRRQNDSDLAFWGLLILHVFLFPSPLTGTINTTLGLVRLRRNFRLGQFAVTALYLGLSLAPIIKLVRIQPHPPIQSKDLRKFFADYSRQKIGMPLPSHSIMNIPVGRFRLEEMDNTLGTLSYFFAEDWGDSFDPRIAPIVKLSDFGRVRQLQPLWKEHMRVPFSYKLSFSHLGKLEIVVPRGELENVRLGSLEIKK